MDSSHCIDCGIDTCPCSEKRGCRHQGKWQHYAVWNEVWAAAELAPDDGYLCIPCLELRLGRELTYADFPPLPLINRRPRPWDTPLLAKRRTAGHAHPELLLANNDNWYESVRGDDFVSRCAMSRRLWPFGLDRAEASEVA